MSKRWGGGARRLAMTCAVLGAAAAALPATATAALTGAKPWAVVLCNFANQSSTPGTIAEYERLWEGGTTSALDFTDYWRDVSGNRMHVDGTTVVGWNRIPLTRDEWGALSRYDKIRTCAETATSQVDFSRFFGVSAIFPEADGRTTAAMTDTQTTMTVAGTRNVPTPPFRIVMDDGTDTTGDGRSDNAEVLRVTAISGDTWTVERGVGGTGKPHRPTGFIVPGDLGNWGPGPVGIRLGGRDYALGLVVGPHHYNMTGIAHEVGHGFGWDHSRVLSTSTTDYGDCYDIMSAYATCSFVGDFGGSNLGSVDAAAGPGFTGIYLDREGWLDPARVRTLSTASCDQRTVALAALSAQSAPGLLTLKVPASVAIATPGGGSTTGEHFWVEHRERSGWDRGLPDDAVVLHLRGADGVAYWVDDAAVDGRLQAGDTYANPAQQVFLAVHSVDRTTHLARISASRCRLVPQLRWAGDISGQVTDVATLAAVLSVGGAPVPGEPVTLRAGTQSCVGRTDASGRATCRVRLDQDPGTVAASAEHAGTQAYEPSAATAAFAVLREDAAIVYDGPAEGDFHDPVVLAADLTDADSGTPLEGRAVRLTIGATDTCSTTTDASGHATCTVTPDQRPGPTTVRSAFAGDTRFTPASDEDAFLITPEETTTTTTSPVVVLDGAPVTLSGRLTEDDGAPVAGRTLVLGLGAQTCTGTTDGDGRATCSLTVASALGPQPLTSRFAGDAFYEPSQDADDTATVFAFPSRGAFAVGDVSEGAAGPGQVTWWADEWSLRNVLTGGPAPASFKGFAAAPASSPPRCGEGWTTRPGNSPSPTDEVPSYMGTLVTSQVTKAGSTIAGDVVRIVVVRTDAGYGASPGSPGTGTVVARFC